MDSLTQLVLGAAVAEASAGRFARRRAALVGAVCGTLPDLDVFISLGDPVSDFTYHRSATHSLLVLSAVAPLIAWLVWRLLKPPAGSYWRWCVTVWLVLVTHALLDALTVYGTQLLWPLSEYPFGLGSIFIIDPLYTLPLLVGLLLVIVPPRPSRRPWNGIGLALSSGYLALAVGAQAHVREFAQTSLSRQNVAYEQIAVLAAPFNIASWRVLVRKADGYAVGWHSLVAPAEELRLRHYASADGLLAPLAGTWSVARLVWFSRGFHAVQVVDGEIRLSDLRMGVEPDRYAFTFALGEVTPGGPIATPVTRVRPRRFRDGDFRGLWRVVWGAPDLGH